MNLSVNDAFQVLATGIFIVLSSVLAISDAKTLRLPLAANLAMLFAGLVLGWWAFGVPFADRVIGALAGYGALQIISLVYQAVRGRQGLGGGDPILLGAIGSWVGWSVLPVVVLGASLLGLVNVVISAIVNKNAGLMRDNKFPLGSFLIISTLANVTIFRSWTNI